MKELSVQEIIEFSQRVEQESYGYYKEAQKKFSSVPDLVELTEELAQAEIDHFNRLRALLDEKRLSEEELRGKIKVEAATYEQCVASREIPEQATSKDILESALVREENTRDLYRQLLAFTNLSPDITDTFTFLVTQEEGHVKIIEHKLQH